MAEATGGRIINGDSAMYVGGKKAGGICIDSRILKEGEWFVALAGKTGRDGHDFLDNAISKGAGGLIVSDFESYNTSVISKKRSVPALVVDDTLTALADAAKALLRKFNPFRIAITGTVGKTSVKELLWHICSRKWKTLRSPENWNTEIGGPLTVFMVEPDHEILIMECAARGHGQIKYLSEIVNPDIAVITAIGPGHLSEFGTIDDVAETKWEIADGMKTDGVVIAPFESPYTEKYTGIYRVMTFGLSYGADVFGTDIELKAGWTHCEINTSSETYHVEIPGTAQSELLNTLCSIAALSNVKIRDEILTSDDIREAIKTFQGISGRSQIIERSSGVEVIFDAYNSNPMSLANALKNLASRNEKSDGTPINRKVAVLGNMLELGSDEKKYHIEAGELLGSLPIDYLITVGELAEFIRNGANSVRVDEIPGEHFSTTNECKNALVSIIKKGDLVLLKASRALEFEKLLEGDW